MSGSRAPGTARGRAWLPLLVCLTLAAAPLSARDRSEAGRRAFERAIEATGSQGPGPGRCIHLVGRLERPAGRLLTLGFDLWLDGAGRLREVIRGDDGDEVAYVANATSSFALAGGRCVDDAQAEARLEILRSLLPDVVLADVDAARIDLLEEGVTLEGGSRLRVVRATPRDGGRARFYFFDEKSHRLAIVRWGTPVSRDRDHGGRGLEVRLSDYRSVGEGGPLASFRLESLEPGGDPELSTRVVTAASYEPCGDTRFARPPSRSSPALPQLPGKP